jgi:hypothetical protein
MAAVPTTLPRLSACVLSVCLTAAAATAAPSVATVDGSFRQGQTVTVSGSGFGPGTDALPYRFDDFESGSAGHDLTWWSLSSSSGTNPKYSDARVHAGNLAALADFTQQYNCTAHKSGLNFTTAYLSYWVYWEKLSGDDSRNIKLARFTAGIPDYKSGDPSIGYTGMGASSGTWYTFNGANDGDYVWGYFVTGGAWHRIELYGKLSTVDQANGRRGFWLDRQTVDWDASYPTLTGDSQATTYNVLCMPLYVAHDAGGPHKIYYDDVYINNTLARVELGDAPTFAACTHMEVQVPTAWSASSITLSANEGSFPLGAIVWLYVIDEDGAVNSAGFETVIGDGTRYALTVNSGSGGGDYFPGQQVQVSANAPPSGMIFDAWAGDTDGLSDAQSPSAGYTMPASAAEITATYRPAASYLLTVNSGSGSGSYTEGTVVNISAGAAPSGRMFAAWIGDTSHVADATDPSTTITMPAADQAVTASYVHVGGGETTLIVDWGDAAGHNAFDLGDWQTVFLGSYTAYTSAGPDGIQAAWTGTGFSGSVRGSDEQFAVGDQIVVTWYNASASGSYTFTPRISFTDGDWYDTGTTGTWYDMSAATCPAGQSVTTTYTFDGALAGSYDLVNVCRFTNGCENLLMDKIELVEPYVPPLYTLTVNSGLGSGTYEAGTVVNVGADAAPSGRQFDEWAGDTNYLADADAPETTLAMPPDDAEITATYADIPSRPGDLDGNGFVGQADLDIVLANWGCGGEGGQPLLDPRADPSGDGFVGQADLDIVLANWGQGTLPD